MDYGWQVSLNWSKGTVRPTDEVTLNVSVSEPGSLVGILVVDKATRRPEAHNDLTKDMVRKTNKHSGKIIKVTATYSKSVTLAG